MYEGLTGWIRYCLAVGALDRSIIRETISSHYIPFYTTRLHCCYYLYIPLWGSVDCLPASQEVGQQVFFTCIRLKLKLKQKTVVIADSIYSIRILYWLIWLLPLMVRSGTRVSSYWSVCYDTIVLKQQSSNTHFRSAEF